MHNRSGSGPVKQTQLIKGVLEGCVLLIVADGEVYGYQMVQLLRTYGFTRMVAGTVYPLLQKLEKQGCLASRIGHSPDGPDRKYYYRTPVGRKRCREFVEQWRQLAVTVNQLIQLKGAEENE